MEDFGWYCQAICTSCGKRSAIFCLLARDINYHQGSVGIATDALNILSSLVIANLGQHADHPLGESEISIAFWNSTQ